MTTRDADARHLSGTEPALSTRGRYLILLAAFLGWMFAGMEMSLIVPTTRPAIQDFAAASLAAGMDQAERTIRLDPD